MYTVLPQSSSVNWSVCGVRLAIVWLVRSSGSSGGVASSATKRSRVRATPCLLLAKKATTAKNTTPQNALKSLTALPKTKTASARNQPANPALPADNIALIANAFNAIREILEAAAVNLRSKDRERRNGVGIKRQGFIERAFTLAADNVNFLPRYLTLEQFQQSFDYFISLRALFDSCTQLREFIWNLVVEAADITFVDAGEFYKAVQEAPRVAVNKTSKQMANMPSAKTKILNIAE
jgi:hypothetical protein